MSAASWLGQYRHMRHMRILNGADIKSQMDIHVDFQHFAVTDGECWVDQHANKDPSEKYSRTATINTA